MAIIVLILGLLVSGCASSGNPTAQREDLIAQIKIGESSKEDVRRLFGRPTMVSRGSAMPITTVGGVTVQPAVTETWNYTYTNIATNPVTFVPVVGLFAGSATARTASFTVQFDDKGIVRHIRTGQSEATGGPGAGQIGGNGQ